MWVQVWPSALQKCSFDATYQRRGFRARIEHWVKQDHIPVRQVSSDVEDGQVVIVIGIVGTATEQAKQTIFHDLGGHTMGGFPVSILGIDDTNTNTTPTP